MTNDVICHRYVSHQQSDEWLQMPVENSASLFQCFVFVLVFVCFFKFSILGPAPVSYQAYKSAETKECCPGWEVGMAAMACLFLSHAHITCEFGIAFQEWPECIPCDESALPPGNIPVGLYGPSR